MNPRSFGAFAHEPDEPGLSAPDGAGSREPGNARPDPDPEAGKPDPLRGSRTSGFWAAVLVLVVVLLLLAVFILQNTQKVDVSFFGWQGSAPLSATLLIAAVAGALLVACAGLLRILQLRRRVRRGRRTS